MNLGRGKKARACLMVLALAAGMTPGLARADGNKPPEDPDFIAVGAGVYDVLHNYTTEQARVEYRFGERFWFIKPVVGGLVTGDKSVMGYAGIRIDLYFGSRWVLTPNGVIGGWSRGDGKNLGSTVEFKTGAELAYRFDDRSRLGLAFDHISNAGIGKHNPGTESLMVLYSIPIGSLTDN